MSSAFPVARAANPIANVSTAGRNLDRGIGDRGIKFTGSHCVRSGLAAVEPVPNGFAFEGFIEFTADFDRVGVHGFFFHGSPNPRSVNSKQPQARDSTA